MQSMTSEEFAAASLEDLLVSLGRQLATAEFGAGYERPYDLAVAWLRQHRDELRRRFCTSDSTKELLKSNAGGLEVAAGLADLGLGATTGIAPFSVTVVIAKFGLRRFCAGETP